MSVRLRKTSTPVDQPQGSVVRGLVTHPLRWLTWGSVAVLLCTVAVVGGFQTAGVNMSTVGQVSPVAVVANLSGGAETSAPVKRRPAEDDPAFNPCTMGVNGNYSESDPRYYRPGPCDMSTVLPYGARFEVSVSADPDACSDSMERYGWYGALVVVRAVAAPEYVVTVASAVESVCVPREDVPLAGAQGLVSNLLVDVAGQLDR